MGPRKAVCCNLELEKDSKKSGNHIKNRNRKSKEEKRLLLGVLYFNLYLKACRSFKESLGRGWVKGFGGVEGRGEDKGRSTTDDNSKKYVQFMSN